MEHPMTHRPQAIKGILRIGVTATLGVVCPPVGLAVAAFQSVKSARKFVQSGDTRDAQGMVSGYSEIVDVTQSGAPNSAHDR